MVAAQSAVELLGVHAHMLKEKVRILKLIFFNYWILDNRHY